MQHATCRRRLSRRVNMLLDSDFVAHWDGVDGCTGTPRLPAHFSSHWHAHMRARLAPCSHMASKEGNPSQSGCLYATGSGSASMDAGGWCSKGLRLSSSPDKIIHAKGGYLRNSLTENADAGADDGKRTCSDCNCKCPAGRFCNNCGSPLFVPPIL